MAHSTFQYYSKTLNMDARLEIVLPECFHTGFPKEGERLPLLVLLHGMMGGESSYCRLSSLERYAEDLRLMIVTPSTHLGAYTNQYAGPRYFDYVALEVPDVCSRYYPAGTSREERMVAGLSMGGYGALKIGLTYPERFSRVATMSAGCDRLALLPEVCRSITSLSMLHAVRGELDEPEYLKAMQFLTAFGSPERYLASKQDNLFLFAQSVKRAPAIRMMCGTEDFALDMNRRFHEALEKQRIPHEYLENAGGHTWAYWDENLPQLLRWIAEPAAEA